MQEQHDLLSNDLLINDNSQANLISSAKWGKFLSIVGFAFCGLMVIGGIIALLLQDTSAQAIMPSMNTYYGYGAAFIRYIGIFYIVFAIILFFPCLYLLKFSNKIQEAVRSSSQESLDTAFINLKAMFKFYGIFTIVILSVYALAIIFFILATLAR